MNGNLNAKQAVKITKEYFTEITKLVNQTNIAVNKVDQVREELVKQKEIYLRDKKTFINNVKAKPHYYAICITFIIGFLSLVFVPNFDIKFLDFSISKKQHCKITN